MGVGLAGHVAYLPRRELRTSLTGQIIETVAPVVVLVWFIETHVAPVLEGQRVREHGRVEDWRALSDQGLSPLGMGKIPRGAVRREVNVSLDRLWAIIQLNDLCQLDIKDGPKAIGASVVYIVEGPVLGVSHARITHNGRLVDIVIPRSANEK